MGLPALIGGLAASTLVGCGLLLASRRRRRGPTIVRGRGSLATSHRDAISIVSYNILVRRPAAPAALARGAPRRAARVPRARRLQTPGARLPRSSSHARLTHTRAPCCRPAAAIARRTATPGASPTAPPCTWCARAARRSCNRNTQRRRSPPPPPPPPPPLPQQRPPPLPQPPPRFAARPARRTQSRGCKQRRRLQPLPRPMHPSAGPCLVCVWMRKPENPNRGHQVWQCRWPQVAEVLEATAADIICLQEVDSAK
jgi:hypothetical protein